MSFGYVSIPLPTGNNLDVAKFMHPMFNTLSPYWLKWRLTYEGGEEFKRRYLKRFSNREDFNQFLDRREMSYVPAFAKIGINEIRNSIFQRLNDITRVTTSQSYNDAVEGKNGGVDRRGSTMEYFFGTQVLKELLVMKKVGIYVDSPSDEATNYLESVKRRPYIYVYKAEQILSWTHNDDATLASVLLEDVDYNVDEYYGLPYGLLKRFRFYWIAADGYVHCQFYNDKGVPDGPEHTIYITMIPFHILEISESLMTDVCDYQIALMNIASSDIQFARLANFPLYVEKFDLASEMVQQSLQPSHDSHPETDGSVTKTEVNNPPEKQMGTLNGRRFPNAVEFPKWVSPDTAPIVSSMAKQEQMKKEIRSLLFLALGNLQATRQSADSKQADISQEENGLSYIGFELSLAENEICRFWHAYENNKNEFTIKYPTTYDIKTTAARIDEATGYIKLVQIVNSLTYKKELLKRIARALLGGTVSYSKLSQCYKEIDKLEMIVDPIQLITDIENRLVSREYASEIVGYPTGEPEKANKEAVDQATAIIEAQAAATPQSTNAVVDNPAARGIPELSANPKQDVQNDRNKNKQYQSRGKGKVTNSSQVKEPQ